MSQSLLFSVRNIRNTKHTVQAKFKTFLKEVTHIATEAPWSINE